MAIARGTEVTVVVCLTWHGMAWYNKSKVTSAPYMYDCVIHFISKEREEKN